MTRTAFLRTQGLIGAFLNAWINPGLAWALNPHRLETPLLGKNALVTDTAITCLVLPLLVSLFTSAGVARALRTGQLVADPGFRAGPLLGRLPRNPWALGLALGAATAALFTPLTWWAFHSLGLRGLPFAGVALFKALYTALLGYAVTRWVILRQLASGSEGEASHALSEKSGEHAAP